MKKIFTFIMLAAPLAAFSQWSAEPQVAVPEGTSYYTNDYVVSPDGSVWNMLYHPDVTEAKDEYDTNNVVYQYIIQRYDPEGVKQFHETDLGMVLSQYPNWSWTLVNDMMYADSEGNLVIAVSDARNSTESQLSFTAYKISPEGKMLWDEDGVALDGGASANLVAGMKIIELEDGSFVFAWMKQVGETMTIQLQRLSNDGKVLWEPGEVQYNKNGNNQYPYLVKSANNQFILIYAKGSTQALTATKLDFDGTPVWSEDVTIYNGGWGSTPLWTKVSVVPSGDGGALVAWNDDRNFTWVESAFVSYVTEDGKLGFLGASPLGEVKVSYAGWKCFNCTAIPSSDGESFIAAWRETDSSQGYQQLSMQKISKKGELLWDEEGVTVTDKIEDILKEWYVSYSAQRVLPGAKGQAALFYMERDSRTTPETFSVKYVVVNESDGSMWDKGTQIIAQNDDGTVDGLQSFVCVPQQFWIANYDETYVAEGEDGSTRSKSTNYIQKYNFNGNTGNQHNSVDKNVAESRVEFNGRSLYLYGEDAFDVSVYDLAGTCVMATGGNLNGKATVSLAALAEGIYVVKANVAKSTETLKVVIR